MADKSRSSKDSFVSKVVTDPGNVPDALLLSGWLGDSSMPDHTRLYSDPQLSSYVEIPDDAILHTQEQAAETLPPGGSFVWIKKDAVLTHRSSADKTKARFLEGPITQQFGAAGLAGFTHPLGIQSIVAAHCPQFASVVCPTHQWTCQSIVVAHCPPLVVSVAPCVTHRPGAGPC